MNIVETDYWCLLLPPEWSAEQEEDTVCVTDQDGIGELAVTALIREQDDAGRGKPCRNCRARVAGGHRLGRRGFRRIFGCDRVLSGGGVGGAGVVFKSWPRTTVLHLRLRD